MTSGSEAVSWNVQSSTANGIYSNPTYQYDQHPQLQPPGGSVQDGQSVSSVADYYNSYQQQQPNHAYSQPVGAYQNTGYQNSNGYANQAPAWNNDSYSSYASHPYTSYATDSSSSYSTGAAATSVQYQPQYNQWAEYYSQTEVSCAPGTENLSVPSSSTLGCPVPAPAAASGYAPPNYQPPQSYPQYWAQESSTPAVPPLQPAAVNSGGHDDYWKHGAQTSSQIHQTSSQIHQTSSQIHQTNPIQPNYQSHLDLNSSYDKFQDQQQKTVSSQGTNLYFPLPPPPPPPQQVNLAPLQSASSLDTKRVNKLQIPTNPRIASNLTYEQPKPEKDSSTSSAALKPAYIAVSLTKPTEKLSSNDAANSILKPGMFPKSLRGYVERALARCKDDKQMAACQAVMKEMITKATADCTLCTRNWDMEPLFPMPEADAENKDNSLSSTHDSLLPKSRKSPRRSKSRWEPLPEEKLVDHHPVSTSSDTVKYSSWVPPVNHHPVSTSNDTVKYSSWVPNEKDRKVVVENKESKEDSWRNTKFSPLFQRISSKAPQRPFKKQRLADVSTAHENGDASSDSDKEQSLTAYYSAAMAFNDTPEEKKRRESRSKRFDLGQAQRTENNHSRKKNARAGNLYNRRASALVLSKSFDNGVSKAVEDIDWDALTVKGTCQEIEKRYLRLTSAPDPATVRPEEVLEKALLMVQNSQRNYLYKCDQLKSIRQDLTVQRIHNQLTVKVYETHARLALEVGDLPEYNQCQSQLKALYAEGIKGSYMEFAAYNLLCVIMHSNNYRELLSSMARLSDEAKKDEAVKHALAVRAAVTSGNYVAFFRLYKAAPNLNTCLMDLYVEKMRYKAVTCMCRSYRPTVPVSYVSQVLGFSSVVVTNEANDEKEAAALEECLEWLKAHGASIIADNNGDMMVDTKVSSSSLFVPEPEDAVAHGDANLAVNDFLAKAPL
ncbi:hypothetical protein MtrunA17_Chr3g0115101 [Medicago truncatula]|uniref:PCI domain-containing protein n=1 Tax=Medicago truncatula TaxID=3880 RepID=A0A396IV89_MEDTR|nr:hypothetical protein MtrunA17_Chr3g0115101 [Medicago truncatula]